MPRGGRRHQKTRQAVLMTQAHDKHHSLLCRCCRGSRHAIVLSRRDGLLHGLRHRLSNSLPGGLPGSARKGLSDVYVEYHTCVGSDVWDEHVWWEVKIHLAARGIG